MSEEEWAKVTWARKMDPQDRIDGWNARLRKMNVSKREWTVAYFPSEKRYKVRGEFTNDEGEPRGPWRWETVAGIERILWEFEEDEQKDQEWEATHDQHGEKIA